MRIVGYDTVQVTGDNLTLPLLVWRRYRRPMPGLVEQIIDSHYGLADLGPTLPVGTMIEMPVVDLEAVPTRQVVRLWD